MLLFKKSKQIFKCLGYFCYKIGYQELKKFAQSGLAVIRECMEHFSWRRRTGPVGKLLSPWKKFFFVSVVSGLFLKLIYRFVHLLILICSMWSDLPMNAAGIDVRNIFWLRTGTPLSSSCMSLTSCSSWNGRNGLSLLILVKQYCTWSSGYGRKLMFWRSCVWIPVPYTGWIFFT